MSLRATFLSAAVMVSISGVAAAQSSPAGDAVCSLKATDPCISEMGGSTVMLRPRPKGPIDPLSKYGAGFYVVIKNTGRHPIYVSPVRILFMSPKGQVYKVLSKADIEQRAQAAADRKRKTSTWTGVGIALLAGGVAGYGAGVDPTAASNVLNGGVLVATSVANNGQEAALKTEFDGDVAGKTYGKNIFGESPLEPSAVYGGQLIVDGLKDGAPVVVTIMTGRDTHTFTFKAQ